MLSRSQTYIHLAKSSESGNETMRRMRLGLKSRRASIQRSCCARRWRGSFPDYSNLGTRQGDTCASNQGELLFNDHAARRWRGSFPDYSNLGTRQGDTCASNQGELLFKVKLRRVLPRLLQSGDVMRRPISFVPRRIWCKAPRDPMTMFGYCM